MNQKVIYELAVLYKAALEDNIDQVSDKFKKLIKDADGRIIKEDNWGLRELAYKIAKETQALYIFYDLELPPEAIGQLEASFNIADEILRYQFYKPDLKALKMALDNPQAQLQPVKSKNDDSSELDKDSLSGEEDVA